MEYSSATYTPLDDSCEAWHGPDSKYCHDFLHTLANHVTTPFFIGECNLWAKDTSGPWSAEHVLSTWITNGGTSRHAALEGCIDVDHTVTPAAEFTAWVARGDPCP